MTSKSAQNIRLSDNVRFAEMAAKHYGIPCQMLDEHSGYLCRIGSGAAAFLLGGGNVSSWPVNNASASTLATDKGFSALVLEEQNLRSPKGSTIFLSNRYTLLREKGRELSDAPTIASQIGWPVIAKPNNGSRGAFVKLCKDGDELLAHLSRMGERYDIGLIQEYVRGDEYRVFVFGNQALFSYRKQRGAIVGDGVRSVLELISDVSAELVGHGLDPIDPTSKSLIDAMARRQLTPQSVLPRAATLEVGARANLSAGGTPADFTTDVSTSLAETGIRATMALGLMVAGVDVIVPKENPSAPVVIEVNSNPAVSSLEKVGRLDLAMRIFGMVFERMRVMQAVA
jgi:glutathione synthase/RimK-type ligase-like ATP-grasp enzyme